MAYNKKYEKFSYSKLNTFESCAFKYDLTYNKGHYTYADTVATMMGTLVHWVEESIARSIKDGEPINYDKLKEDFLHIEIPKTSPYDQNGGIYGIDYIKREFPEDFFKANEKGESYLTKSQKYLQTGIYRLEKYIKANPGLTIYGMEQYFQIDFKNHMLSGYIDRIFYDTVRDIYLIEDIKTKDKPFREEDLVTPLQFVIYTKALSSMLDIPVEKIQCAYDLPFCDIKQPITNTEYIKRGIKKLDKIFEGIESKDFKPNPSPLCAYCPFSPTNPDQPADAQNLCCYYSLWTPNGSHKVWEVAHKWEGMERNEEILKEFFEDPIDFDF